MSDTKRRHAPSSEAHPKRTFLEEAKIQTGYYLMILPAVLCFLLFSYIPLVGLYMAFTEYKPAKGIFGSSFVGLAHFRQFFGSMDFVRVFRNTILYSLGRIFLLNIVTGIVFALLLYEIRSHMTNKIYHTCMLLPAFLSWTVVSACLLIMLHPDNGLINALLQSLGLQPISWYRQSRYWPTIIMACFIYKDAGMAAIYYYAALLGIDTEQFDAAQIDGANRLQQIRHISLPALNKVFCITLIMQLGSVLGTSMTPYYQLTYNQTQLYETTQVLGTYIFNGLGGGRYSFMTAVGLVQSLIGLILVLTSNGIISKVDPESAMF